MQLNCKLGCRNRFLVFLDFLMPLPHSFILSELKDEGVKQCREKEKNIRNCRNENLLRQSRKGFFLTESYQRKRSQSVCLDLPSTGD